MTEYRDDREKLLNKEERRGWAEEYRFNKDPKTGDYILEGYAATYEPYDCHGGPNAGGWIEQLDARAFDDTLATQPDVQLLINHTGEPLARTKSGTLKLSRDGHGLKVWARLDPSDPDVQRLAPKMLRKDMDEMSFAFRVTKQDWDTGYTHRTIRSLSLQKGDVSVVNYGMNPGTQASLDATVDMLAQLSNQQLVELRSQIALDPQKIQRAAQVLSAIGEPAGPVPAGIIGAPKTTRKDSKASGKGKEPYGDVDYADPGYKTDGKKRYPINNADKVRAAWSYINMPKNQSGYTSSQVKAIKGRIKAAAKKFGVDISDSKSEAGFSHVEQIHRQDGHLDVFAVLTDGTRVPITPQRALPAAKRAVKSKVFHPDTGTWNPNAGPDDPHDEDISEGSVGTVNEVAPDWDTGPVPGNIVGGQWQPQHPTFQPPTSQSDPHDTPKEENEELAMDPHDTPYGDAAIGAGSHLTPVTQGGSDDPHNTPYSVGAQVGSVSGDRPNYSGGAHGAPAGAPNIITGGSNYSDTNPGFHGVESAPATGTPVGGSAAPTNIVTSGPALGTGGFTPPTTPATGTNGPVDAPSQAYDWTTGPIGEPCDPEEELDHAVGEARADDDDDDEDKVPPLDLCMAEALDRTIVHVLGLTDPAEIRKGLNVARRQLSQLRGVQPGEEQPVNDITRMYNEIRQEVGEPTTGKVVDYFKYLQHEGSAPVGYRGVLDSDPSAHVRTAGERLLQEAREKDREARAAQESADVAAQRVKAARREAELNDVIRRHQNAAAERPRRA